MVPVQNTPCLALLEVGDPQVSNQGQFQGQAGNVPAGKHSQSLYVLSYLDNLSRHLSS